MIYYDDYRYMGGIDIVAKDDKKYFAKVGPDLLEAALTKEISLQQWLSIFKPKRKQKTYRAICTALLDQSTVSGIGNYLKSEILYQASISPDRSVDTISDEEWDKVRIAAHAIILKSYEHGGLTIESFISPDGKLGVYPAMVYGKETDPEGRVVEKITTRDQRGTYWVPEVQV